MPYCECQTDGFCQRYRRDMTGRFRQICQGTNVDLGTAAAFREQWAREAQPPVKSNEQPTPLILHTDQMPGDTVVMTAAIHSLHRAYPGRYTTAVISQHPEVFSYNPDVIPVTTDAAVLHMHYPAIHLCNERGIHFMQGWTEFLGSALKINIPLLTNRPRLYFPDPEPPTEDYWLICSGGKRDFTTKLWGTHNYQEVVHSLKGAVRFVQVGNSRDEHSRLHGVEDIVGKTTLRELFNWTRRARGVLCGVSLLMHVAAALEKPAVVVAGGREPVQWNAYPRQQYIHTVGMLPCRSVQGHIGHACWRSRVVPLSDGSVYDQNTCEFPVNSVPKCMQAIFPATIADQVMRYNELAN